MTKEKIEKYVIVDTDLGTDDAWALLMLLKAEKCFKNIKILALTCVAGNTTLENVVKNTYYMLHSTGRTDIPIYKGATEALLPRTMPIESFHGSNGMGDVDFWIDGVHPANENEFVQPENAVQAIRDLVLKYPNKVSLICLGPLTNIALAVKTYSEIKDKIKDIHLMGGNFRGVGNTSACAEFNFLVDPEAAHITMDSFKCPITVLPWEGCLEDSLFLSKEWRFKTFDNIDCKCIQLLNEAEAKIYRNFECFMPCDAYLTAAFLFPDKCIRKKQNIHVTVELHGIHTRGQMVLDHLGKNDHNVTIIQLLNEDEIRKTLHWTGFDNELVQNNNL